MGNVDAVGLLSLDPAVVVDTVVELPRIGLLVDFGGEDAGNLVLHDLEDGRGMHDHVVDGIARGGVAASASGGGRIVDGHGGIEPTRRNGDDLHIVEHLNIVVHVVIAVHNHAGHAALNELIGVGVHEQDATLIGDFGIVQSGSSIVNQAKDGSRSGSLGLDLSSGSRASILGKAVGIQFGDNLSP